MASLPVSFISNGDNQLIPGAAGKFLQITGINIRAASAVDITFYDGPSDSDPPVPLSGTIPLGPTTGTASNSLQFVLDPQPYTPAGGSRYWMQTITPGNKIVAKLSAGVAVNGVVTYESVGAAS